MGTLETDRDFMKFLATLESMQQKAEGDEGSGEAGKATNSILHWFSIRYFTTTDDILKSFHGLELHSSTLGGTRN